MQWGNKVVCVFLFFLFFFSNQFVFLVEVSCFIGGGGFVSAAKLGRARLCVVASSPSRRGGGVGARARDAGATRRAKEGKRHDPRQRGRGFVVRVSESRTGSAWTKPDSIIYAPVLLRSVTDLPFRASCSSCDSRIAIVQTNANEIDHSQHARSHCRQERFT